MRCRIGYGIDTLYDYMTEESQNVVSDQVCARAGIAQRVPIANYDRAMLKVLAITVPGCPQAE